MKVQILLSTYNGEKYLEEQLESLVKQEDIEISILVRDDGSTDSTHDILNRWQEKGLLRWYTGQNLKPAKSFLQLLFDADEADYYAFCDQDDYWYPDKLSSAVNKLSSANDKAGLYFSQTQLADKELNKIESVIIRPYITFGESLVYQFVGGCTMVLNRQLRDVIVKYRPSFLSMHDVWVYDVALAIGAEVIFDPIPHMLYRQHGGNVIGQGFGKAEKWKRSMNRIFNKSQERSRLAKEIKEGFKDVMACQNLLILEKFLNGKINIWKRLLLYIDKDFRCSHKRTYRKFQLAVLLNLY